MKTPKDDQINTLLNHTSKIEVEPVREEMKKSMKNSKRFTNPTRYEIHKTTVQMYRVRFTNGLEGLLSEQAVEEGRWGNIESKEKDGLREINYITM